MVRDQIVKKRKVNGDEVAQVEERVRCVECGRKRPISEMGVFVDKDCFEGICDLADEVEYLRARCECSCSDSETSTTDSDNETSMADSEESDAHPSSDEDDSISGDDSISEDDTCYRLDDEGMVYEAKINGKSTVVLFSADSDVNLCSATAAEELELEVSGELARLCLPFSDVKVTVRKMQPAMVEVREGKAKVEFWVPVRDIEELSDVTLTLQTMYDLGLFETE